jgi:hypothetical protein
VPRSCPAMPGAIVSTRPRSLGRRPRAHPLECAFLHSSYSRVPRPLRGNALHVVKDSYPHLVGFPDQPPIGEPFFAWERPWIIRESTLGAGVGLGLFVLVDVHVDACCPPDDRPELLPFYGPKYSALAWRILSRQCPTYSRYGISLKGDPRFTQMDGYPPRTGNISGYINSTRRLRRQGFYPNAEWVEHVHTQHPRMDVRCTHYIMTHATRTIRAGDEILVDYDWH